MFPLTCKIISSIFFFSLKSMYLLKQNGKKLKKKEGKFAKQTKIGMLTVIKHAF